MRDCDECDGSGWREVQERYAQHLADQKHDREADPRSWHATFAAARNSVYPCKACQPDRFWRWANKHFNADHDGASCIECSGVRPKRKHRADRRPRDTGPPPPTDDDLARSEA